MWVLCAVSCAFLIIRVEGLKYTSLSYIDGWSCNKNCSPQTAEACCIGGESFGAVELEASISIFMGNDEMWRIEAELMKLTRESDQQQRHQQVSRIMRKVHALSKQALHWLCAVKLKLARFTTHDVVGAAARRIYDVVRSQVILFMSLINWSTDEIAGIDVPPPTVEGFGICGGRWPCQPMITCTMVSCQGEFKKPFKSIEATNRIPQIAESRPGISPDVRYRSNPHYRYTPNPRLPLPQSPYFIIEPALQDPGNIAAENKQDAENYYEIPTKNEPLEQEEEVHESKSPPEQRTPLKREKLPVDYYDSNSHQRIPTHDEVISQNAQLQTNQYGIPGLFDPPPQRSDKGRFRPDPDQPKMIENSADGKIGVGHPHRKNGRQTVIKDPRNDVDVSGHPGGLIGIPKAYKLPKRSDGAFFEHESGGTETERIFELRPTRSYEPYIPRKSKEKSGNPNRFSLVGIPRAVEVSHKDVPFFDSHSTTLSDAKGSSEQIVGEKRNPNKSGLTPGSYEDRSNDFPFFEGGGDDSV